MNQEKVDFIIATCHGKFKPAQMMQIRKMLEEADDSKFAYVQAIELKDPTLAFVLSVLLGELGIDRFYVGDIAIGILKLLTFGCCLVFWFVDLFLIMNRTREWNFQQITMALI